VLLKIKHGAGAPQLIRRDKIKVRKERKGAGRVRSHVSLNEIACESWGGGGAEREER
jgi:hypothetical protein